MSSQRPEPLPPAIDAGALYSDPAAAVKAFIRARREWFERVSAARMDAMAVNAASSDAIDAAVAMLFDRAASSMLSGDNCAVLALGGYGRREMGPLSDIDLLFLVGPDATAQEKAVTDGILYPFWDSGIEVGGATRTIADCRSVIAHDVRALTALIEARLVCGSGALHGQLCEMLQGHFAVSRERRRYAQAKIEERRERLSRYGDSLYLLQPDVKEGEGGLRDYHTLRWVCFAARPQSGPDAAYLHFLAGATERASLQGALRFLWSVRHLLNLRTGSRSDRLLDSLQGDLAGRLGFVAEGKATAAERFMSEYYRNAEALHLLCEQGIEAGRRELHPATRAARWLRRRNLGDGILRTEHGTLALRQAGEPTNRGIAELFLASRRSGVAVDALSKRRIAESMAAVDRAGIPADAGRWLPELFAGLPHLDRTLRDLRDAGVLTRLLPEMEAAFHHVQHDGFHYYTAGVHSIRAVGELSELASGKIREEMPLAALKRIRRRHVLSLAALLHDAGKGQGGEHEEKGALLARAAAQRIGFAPEDAADVEFLVRSHLLMSVLAFRRDVSDPGLIERFSHSFRAPELLAMLYLLTWADLRTIGPHIWSDWKGGLLADLYRSTHERMTESGAVSQERQRRERERLTRAVAKLMGRDCGAERVREFLRRLPQRYGHAVEPETVAAHLMMTAELARQPLATFVRPAPERGCTEFSVVTADAPGLFAKIAGVLSAGGANIVDAQVFTTSDGLAIDVIWISDPMHRPFEDPDALARIRAELLQAITGREELHAIVGGRFKRRLLSQMGRQRPPEVFVDNDVSATHTVVEVHADDRRGLLYAIASVFHELACTIDLARITTSVDRVIDVFYIRDAQGGKIDSRDRIRAVSERLIEALE